MSFDIIKDWPKSYNVTPTQIVPCIREEEGQCVGFAAEWGLIPSWAKDKRIGAQCTNARSDTVDTKPSYRSAYKRRRCLVLASGFYEWDQHHSVKGQPKQPFYFTLRDGHPWTFAGLWEEWTPVDAPTLTTCTIITAGPNEIMEPFHDRTPVQIPPEYWHDWLSTASDPVKLKLLLIPYDSAKIQCWPVTTRINSTRQGHYIFGPECIQPVDYRSPKIQKSLF